MNGTNGTNGADAQGSSGAEGSVGPQGAQGVPGPQGLQGESGGSGPIGPAGSTGSSGIAGSQGPRGLTGNTGGLGPAGIQGIQGRTGAAADPATTDALTLRANDLQAQADDQSDQLVVLDASIDAKQDILLAGDPAETHHKILQGNSVLSLTAGGGVTIQQRDATHLGIGSSALAWSAGPLVAGGVHYLNVGETGLSLLNPSGLVVGEVLSNGRGTVDTVTASNVMVVNDIEADAARTRNLSVNGRTIQSLLSDREGKFTAVAPFLKAITETGEVNFLLDPTSDLNAGHTTVLSLRTGTVRSSILRSNNGNGVTITTSDNFSTFAAGEDKNCTCFGDLRVNGTLSCDRITSPYWVAGRINGIGTLILSTKGRHAFTFAREQQGYYRITWSPAHPDGTSFIVFCQGEGLGSTWNILSNANAGELANTTTSALFVVRNNTFGITDGIINFAILA